MAVVINEFEVEAQPERQAAANQAAEPQPTTEPTASKMEEILRRQAERDERLRAH
jgi:hypothetical protein